MKKLLYLLLIPMLLSACKAKQQPVVETTTAVPTTSNSGNTYRFIVSFYSIGTGTNGAAIQQLDEFVKKYEAKNKVAVPYVPVRWGREGEVDYCFKLDKLNVQQQAAFITETKTLLKGAEHVNYKENAARE